MSMSPNSALAAAPSSSSSTTLSPDTITNIVFGLTASIIGVVTIYQARRAWSIRNEHRLQLARSTDLELGEHPGTSSRASTMRSGTPTMIADEVEIIASTRPDPCSAPALALETSSGEPKGVESL